MRGIRLRPGTSNLPSELPSGSFVHFFAPVLPRLRLVHWLYHSWPFAQRDDAFRQALSELPPSDGTYNSGFGYIPPDLLLPRFAHFVTDDWASLYGFHTKPDASSFFKAMESGSYWTVLDRTADLCFFNVDAVWWDFYARDESLLEIVRTHAASLGNVNVEERDLLNADW